MYGEPIESVKEGVKNLVSALQCDPYALETAYLSVITFDSTAQQVVPLTEVNSFVPPLLSANGCTALGGALELVSQRIDAEVTKTTADVKGDWRPLVFIMTDGMPTDSITLGVQEFRKRKCGMVVACAAGADADTNTLKQITECVVQLASCDKNSLKAFFKWVTASIVTSSKSVNEGQGDVENLKQLPPPPPEINIVV